ncbi:MAG: hypothetical protein Q7S02_03955 [bacterium]|nr:hypothetical protein [bacterium]
MEVRAAVPAAPEAVAVDPEALAGHINGLIDQFHVDTVSDDPFEWTPTATYARGKAVLAEVAELLRGYRHVSKAGKVTMILVFGAVLPLFTTLGAWQLHMPRDDEIRFWTCFGLGVVTLIAIVSACVIGALEEIDLDIGLAWYCISRGWGFSRLDQEEMWERYRKRFDYFDCGDEDQEIRLRIWGKTDDGRPFQLFTFYYETVTYVPVTTRVGKSTVTTIRKVETPHHRYGIFLTVPESKVRFRISEVGGSFGKRVELESAAFNDAVGISCDPADEAEVVKFLSPAVIVAMQEFFANLDGVVLDFYPGMLLVGTEHDFLGNGSVTLDEHAPQFESQLTHFGDGIEQFRSCIDGAVTTFRKYND